MLSTSKSHISLNLRCTDVYNAQLFYAQLWIVILRLIPILRNEEKVILESIKFGNHKVMYLEKKQTTYKYGSIIYSHWKAL